MHKWLVAAALLLVAVPATAQNGMDQDEYSFPEDYLARVGFGDLSRVNGTEPANAWTVAEYVRFSHDGNMTRLGAMIPDAHLVLDCTCGSVALDGNTAVVASDVAAGDYVLRLVRSIPGQTFAGSLVLFESQATSRLVAYVPNGMVLLAGAAMGEGLPCTEGAPCSIHQVGPVRGDDLVIAPAGVYVAPDVSAPQQTFLQEWAPAILGILVGIALWSYLVSKGLVQKRRKQEVAKAAHVEAAASESQDTLTARKRVLMAGLKELEKAKMTKEIDTDVYDALKAELKKETVIVMRALEAAP